MITHVRISRAACKLSEQLSGWGKNIINKQKEQWTLAPKQIGGFEERPLFLPKIALIVFIVALTSILSFVRFALQSIQINS